MAPVWLWAQELCESGGFVPDILYRLSGRNWSNVRLKKWRRSLHEPDKLEAFEWRWRKNSTRCRPVLHWQPAKLRQTPSTNLPRDILRAGNRGLERVNNLQRSQDHHKSGATQSVTTTASTLQRIRPLSSQCSGRYVRAATVWTTTTSTSLPSFGQNSDPVRRAAAWQRNICCRHARYTTTSGIDPGRWRLQKLLGSQNDRQYIQQPSRRESEFSSECSTRSRKSLSWSKQRLFCTSFVASQWKLVEPVFTIQAPLVLPLCTG